MTWQHVAYNRLICIYYPERCGKFSWVYDQLTLEVPHPRTLQKPTVWSWQLLGQHGRSYGELCRLEQKRQNHWQRKLGLIQGLNLWNLTPALHTSNISHMAQAFQALRVSKHPTLPASAMWKLLLWRWRGRAVRVWRGNDSHASAACWLDDWPCAG